MKNKFTGAIIVAAGEGIRSKSTVPKQYLSFGDKIVLEKNIENFIHEPLIDFVLVVINEKHRSLYNKAIAKISSSKLLTPCYGGKTRSHSVKNGLKMISNSFCLVAATGSHPPPALAAALHLLCPPPCYLLLPPPLLRVSSGVLLPSCVADL